MEPQSQATVDLITEQCQRVFQNVLASENFKMLCELLCGNFRGVRVESIAEFSSINSRMREGTYGLFPALFHTDIQQVVLKQCFHFVIYMVFVVFVMPLCNLILIRVSSVHLFWILDPEIRFYTQLFTKLGPDVKTCAVLTCFSGL